MIDRIRTYFLHIPRLVALEVYWSENGEWRIHAAILMQQWDTIRLEKAFYGLDSMRALLAVVPRELPVVICIGGKGVINRTQHLPGARVADLYMQETPLAEGMLLSSVRRSVVDELLQTFGNSGMKVLAVSLGPFAILSFGRLVPEIPVAELSIGRHRLSFNEDWELLEYACLQEEPETGGTIVVAGEELDRRIFPAFAAGCCVLGGLDYPAITIPGMTEEHEEYRQHLFFKRSAMAWLGLLFILLLTNTYFFLHYTDGVAALEKTDMRAVLRETASLKRQLEERDSVMGAYALDKTNSLPMAWIADQLAAGVPATIRLTELMLHPPDELASRSLRRPVFTQDIRISGTCHELVGLNVWMEALRKLRFCSRLHLSQYAFDEKEQYGIFTLIMVLNE